MNATVKPFSQATRSGIVRCRWTVLRNYGNGQYVGALVTDTEFGREHNRVAAADVSLRDSAHFSWAASLLRSDTRTADGDSIQGNGGQAKCTCREGMRHSQGGGLRRARVPTPSSMTPRIHFPASSSHAT